MYEARQNKEKVSRVITKPFKKNTSQYKTIEVSCHQLERDKLHRKRHNNRSSFNGNMYVEDTNANNKIHKRAKAMAEIVEIHKPGSQEVKYGTINGTGVSAAGRANGPSNEEIQNLLTNVATRFDSRRERVNNILGKHKGKSNPKKQLIPTSSVNDIVPRGGQFVGWGNCAEPHSVYNIAKDLKDNQYINSLIVYNAVSVDNGIANDFDSKQDARCKNCQQWTPNAGKPVSFFPKK